MTKKTTSTMTMPGSQIHCVGGDTSMPPMIWKNKNQPRMSLQWMHRSCHFQFFCFDTVQRDYVVFVSPNDPLHSSSIISSTTATATTISSEQAAAPIPFVSLGGITREWNQKDVMALKWFPKIQSTSNFPQSFYALPEHVVMIPFHPLAAPNPGHLVWDSFLPIFTLLDMFQLLKIPSLDTNAAFHNETIETKTKDNTRLDSSRYHPLLIRHILEHPVWAGCEWNEFGNRTQMCEIMLKKFGPLITRLPKHIDHDIIGTEDQFLHRPITTQQQPQIKLFHGQKNNKSNNNNEYLNSKNTTPTLICARHGVAGIGSLTDHGTEKGHGWALKDYTTTHNSGRGGRLWKFRNYLLENPRASDSRTNKIPTFNSNQGATKQWKIIFSEQSSDHPKRNIPFSKHMEALRTKYQYDSSVSIESYRMKDFTVHEQIELVQEASIFISGCGGGAVTAMFLPLGATLVLYFAVRGGGDVASIEKNQNAHFPARLDWDYFNHLSYLHVHWLSVPSNSKKRIEMEANDLKFFTTLINEELKRLQNNYHDNQA